MDRPTVDYDTARNMMVDSQVRPNKVNDTRILAAMRSLPRERFVPQQFAAVAYADADIALGQGRVMLQPMVIARLVQLAAIRGGEQVLVVGAGAGYGAALLAMLGAKVIALEDDPALLALARTALAGIDGITQVSGALADGWPAAAPYDVVFIEGAVEQVPPALAAQLRGPGARLIAIRAGAAGRIGHAVIGERSAAGLALRAEFDCGAPLIPSLRRAPGFVF
jgi:protein-L-isoaspartate(D-aspartate) O-methyltransferase